MGRYNPHAPYILGNEWVPIRQANLIPDSTTEHGYTFQIDHTVTPITGAFYVAEVPQTRVDLVSDLVAVYAAGNEKLTGPIKQVFIPASAIWVTGAAINSSAGVAALQNPSDDKSISFSAPSDNNTFLGVSFDVPSYSQQLFGKRILDVSLRYSLAVHEPTDLQLLHMSVGFAKDMSNFAVSTLQFGTEGTITGQPTQVFSVSLGALNPLWDATRAPYTISDIYPWRYQELARFAATEAAPSRMMFTLFNGLTGGFSAFIYYVEMVVTYCEETRILYGGKKAQLSGSNPAGNYDLGPNLVRLLDTNFASATTTLTPGPYVATVTHDQYPASGLYGAPSLAALRELYPLVYQRGVQVNMSKTVDDEFTSELTPVVAEITLHTSSAVVTGVHPYGVQDDVPVYGTITAIQEIEDDPAGTSKSYPQVRFYARRFGSTQVPLTLVDVAAGVSTVSIDVDTFDALPEIVDGWREVTLRFTTAPSFATAAGDVDWRWQASGELARNQWQILGMGSRAFAAHSIGPASYYAPQGNTVTLTWQSPTISGTADDTLSDAVLIFATDPPGVTGFAISTQTQELTGIAEGCVPSGCIPTGVDYNQLTWTLNSVGDTFDRTEVGTWGNASTGQAWTATLDGVGGSVAVNDGAGKSTSTTAAGTNYLHVASPSADVVQRGQVTVPAIATGGLMVIEVQARFTDINNYYALQILPDTTGFMTLRFVEVVAGVGAIIGPSVTTMGYAANVPINFLVQVVGSRLSAKIWNGDNEEPSYWTVETTDTSLTGVGSTGFRLGTAAGNTNVPFTFAVDNYCSNAFSIEGGSIEIQRSDDVDTDWQTIMLTEDLCVVEYNDFEARVGVETTYRVRTNNALDFSGQWTTGTPLTIPAPGVTIPGTGNSVLIFTSNENPLANLAYVMQFDNQPVEAFAFPEADEVQLQRMYGKDFFTAFHPLERGGDQFSRVLLVNAAAIPLPSLANFRGLRDLAWAQLNYVCVRDELGNRWFANIRVPDSTVRMNRTIYLAQIEVSETTGTPTPVAEVPSV